MVRKLLHDITDVKDRTRAWVVDMATYQDLEGRRLDQALQDLQEELGLLRVQENENSQGNTAGIEGGGIQTQAEELSALVRKYADIAIKSEETEQMHDTLSQRDLNKQQKKAARKLRRAQRLQEKHHPLARRNTIAIQTSDHAQETTEHEPSNENIRTNNPPVCPAIPAPNHSRREKRSKRYNLRSDHPSADAAARHARYERRVRIKALVLADEEVEQGLRSIQPAVVQRGLPCLPP